MFQHLYRPDERHSQSGQKTLTVVKPQVTDAEKGKLLGELIEIDRKMQELKTHGSDVDFSLIQTYKEMLHSRRAYYEKLCRD